MAKLIDLFNERKENLYDYVKYPVKDESDTQPYRYTKLQDAESMDPFFEDRSNPVAISVGRDINRMFQFSKSAKGVVFLGKQTFLQTGNTFAQTRLYNPLNVQIHSVPYVHLPRHVDVLDSDRYDRLQKETSEESISRALNRARSRGGILNTTDTVPIQGAGSRLIDTVVSSFKQAASGISAQFENPTLGENQRPELNLEGDVSYYDTMVANYNRKTPDYFGNPGARTVYLLDGRVVKREFQKSRGLQLWSDKNTYTGGYDDGSIKSIYEYDSSFNLRSRVEDEVDSGIAAWTTKNKKYVEEVQNYLSGSRESGKNMFLRKNISIASPGIPVDGQFKAESWSSPYYKDLTQVNTNIYRSELYPNSDSYDVDSIDVIFTVINRYGNLSEGRVSETVRFRAFVGDINESVSPSYNENKYVGRYETFYTYNKVIRDLSFTLTLHAFSSDELEHVRRKMSYLTSLAYPEYSTNYLTPTICNVTVGKLYVRQPTIIQSISHTISEDSSWDIDRQLPMTIDANISLRILDKKLHYSGEQTIQGPSIFSEFHGPYSAPERD